MDKISEAHPVPKATDAVTVPLRAVFGKNAGGSWAGIGILFAGGLFGGAIPGVGPFAALAATVLMIPVLSTIMRAEAKGEKLSFDAAWHASTWKMLKFLGYSLLTGGVLVLYILAWTTVVLVLASTVNQNSLTLLAALAGIPLFIVALWWASIVNACAAAGAKKPLSAAFLIPIERSIGGFLAAGTVFVFVPLSILFLGIGFFLASLGYSISNNTFDVISAVGIITFVVVGVVASLVIQVTSSLFVPGLSCLVDDEHLPTGTSNAGVATVATAENGKEIDNA